MFVLIICMIIKLLIARAKRYLGFHNNVLGLIHIDFDDNPDIRTDFYVIP